MNRNALALEAADLASGAKYPDQKASRHERGALFKVCFKTFSKPVNNQLTNPARSASLK